MNRSSFIFFAPLMVALLSCKGEKEAEPLSLPPINLSVAPDKDGVIRDLPPRDTSAWMKHMHQMAEKSLGLSPLTNGYDQLEIRVWNERDTDYKGKLFVLQNKDDKWSASLYRYRYYFGDGFGQLDSIVGERKNLKAPKSGWDTFAQKLFALDVLTLPDYERIPSYTLNTDEVGVGAEIGLKNVYRSYTYPTPETRVKEFSEAKKMVDILNLIAKEFKLSDF
jgi:hypothetical protein